MTPLPDLEILSLGAGTQSCALALMGADARTGRGSVPIELPRLDAVVFADTQGELPETYEYLEYLRGYVEDAGIEFVVTSKGSLEDRLLDQTATGGHPTPPAHVVNTDGTKGRVSQYRCSYTYKREMLMRAYKQLCGPRGAWKSKTVAQWIGFSRDETSRMKEARECRCDHVYGQHPKGGPCERKGCQCGGFDRWLVTRWPLVDMRFSRRDTIRWYAEQGHPAPPRSACWFCPNQGNGRWRALRQDHPNLFERAVVLDDALRSGSRSFEGDMFLHASAVPLRDADLRPKAEILADAGQDSLFDEDALAADCAAGICFT